jgi:Acyclic terpene utilisation family protein AtuA
MSDPRSARPVRIANCSGFFGDRAGAAREMVSGGHIDVLTGDWLAELTMVILQKDRERRENGGWARTFVSELETVLDDVAKRGLRVVSNAGGLNPGACADVVRTIAADRGLDIRVASVAGDDLVPRFCDLQAAGEVFAHVTTGEPWPADRGMPITANAYLGAWGIAAALRCDADIVITGRVTDASLVVGPAAWWWNWAPDDWNALAGAVAAGHVIACGAQATGGNFPFFGQVPGMERLGFPIAEIDRDGTSVITKHPGTGGMVSVDTVTAQLLYEVEGPRYPGPDVTTRLDSLLLDQVAPDQVRISGAVGEPPPPTLKVSMTTNGGWRNSVTFVLTGLDIQQKADVCLRALWDRFPDGRDGFDVAAVDLLGGAGSVTGADDGVPLALLLVTVQDHDKAKVGRRFSGAAVEIGLASYPGLFFLAPPADAVPFQRYWPGTVSAGAIRQRVLVDGAEVPVAGPPDRAPARAGQPDNPPLDPVPVTGPVREAPLGRVLGARSGDKGGDLNVGIWARTDESFGWLLGEVSSGRLLTVLPSAGDGLPVDVYLLPNLRAVNLVLRGGLGDGVASSTRVDGQGKSAAEALRAARVPIPQALLD